MALAEGINVRDQSLSDDDGVVLGDDFVAPENVVEDEVRIRREKRGYFSRGGASLTRKIITFNLIALNVLVAGILYLNSSRDGLAQQRADSLAGETELIADVFEAQLPSTAPVNLVTGDGVDVAATLNGIDLRPGIEVFVFDPEGRLAGHVESGTDGYEMPSARHPTYITDAISWVWDKVSAPFSPESERRPPPSVEEQVRALVAPTIEKGTSVGRGQNVHSSVFSVASPIVRGDTPVGVVAVANTTGEIDQLVRVERERVLQMFLVATLVSVGLSLILASTIANPLAELAAAAEVGGARNRNKGAKGGRIRIPDLTARPDEIGRLSGALRGMVAALYHRIDGNEQFAADVAHEIPNPLASLRSAVGTMRLAKREDQRSKLLDVIEHDVRRLDRLVSDISNASRLDSELVKEEQESFDLIGMLTNLSQYLGEEAEKKGVEFITDFPKEPIIITGLEGRLAQVFVNLITNAISFCEDGDAIRLWARKRENRVVVVVEDTGPGIPDQALTKIFQRFYSQRSEKDFGNNSGLGLSISKQIVEAHDGVIWAENIRPTDADITSDPLGARFVVGLPV
ncbi:sensor histidine kinase [Roseovarius indicus]|uniref:sensor histidine kinase n=1 Tax=Roseovarius indicus TaxID=540747 RepID=UPI00351480A8